MLHTTMTTTNDDWETLCAIYDDGEAFDGNGEDNQSNDERKLKLASSMLPNGFCGTVFMTLSTSKIAFARLVKSDGSYRYFTLSRPPILKLDLLYLDSNKEGDDDSYGDDGPSNLRLTWHYYPSEWPTLDKETYRSSLAKKCYSILREEGSFSVCQFLEHDAISFYYEDRGDANEIEELETSVNTSNSWKTYSDPRYPDYLLVILPPHIDQLYYSSPGILFHPREEATKLKQLAAEEKSRNKATSTGKKKIIPSSTNIESTLDFGKHALLQNWKDLYKTRCPICLEESMLFSDGVVLPFCQHYSCRACFGMYLKFKVQDIKQHRINPFLCPVDSCKRELPMGFCKQFLSPEDIKTAKEWYKDLKNPPAWSLDRCLCTKTCGAVGSIRRRKGVTSIEAKATTENTKSSRDDSKLNSSFSALDNLVYCESCNKTWCELCLTRVYDDSVCKPVSSEKQLTKKEADKIVHSVSNHRYHCQPQNILRFCRRYMAASEEIQQKCEAKYPWIPSYSQFCNHEGAALQYALQYILENGQRCPNCLSGVERSEGCFHMKCPTCATHFCYECGTELFPPYYGTHHCWEETVEDEEGNDNNFDYNVDEQLAMALQFME